MSGSSDPISAIVDRMMEKLQKENPNVNYKRKQKKEKVKKSCNPKREQSSLH
jgi:hypothetical protein